MLLGTVLIDETDLEVGNVKLFMNEESIERKCAEIRFPRKRKFKKRLRESAIVEPRTSLLIDETETDSCASLWRSVIVQAIYDISGEGGNMERRLIRADALAWFTSAGIGAIESDFEFVCQLANLVPGKICEMVHGVRENGREIIEGFNFRTVRRDSSGRKGRKF
jgi:hypothetical protein